MWVGTREAGRMREVTEEQRAKAPSSISVTDAGMEHDLLQLLALDAHLSRWGPPMAKTRRMRSDIVLTDTKSEVKSNRFQLFMEISKNMKT